MHTHTHTHTHTRTHTHTYSHKYTHTNTHTQNVFMHKWKHTTMDTLHITWTPKKELLSLCESPRLHIDMNVFSRSLRFDFWINIWTKFGIIRCLVDREEGTECDWMISLHPYNILSSNMAIPTHNFRRKRLFRPFQDGQFWNFETLFIKA